MSELVKLLATRPDARVAVVGPAEVVSKYVAETEKSLAQVLGRAEESDVLLFLDESDALFGKQTEDEEPQRPLVLGVRSIESIPPEFRKGLVVVKAPRPRWWERVRRG
jgi:SpoVK/Ycf46/Vps4 family AAA+-type ATPase